MKKVNLGDITSPSFGRNLERWVKDAAKDALEQNGVEIECPSCGARIVVKAGENVCPSCGKAINAEIDWSQF